ncbi:hypothetical protein ACH4YO_26150 [Streptomyces noursei]|uniref:Uncharacterized protein n=2 Tax=Streptomyces TaxID=1883 RepID=A0A9X8N896_9ACTN|nr:MULTISPECIES: hypothetical protein [Streptomyces]ANZ15848.1 membrane protein [Streptomyces noursei ATCC 11455]AJC55522.1 hypothetical protein GZL_02935 [Streptomyces sp. 769]MCZ0993059.1 hypothetical protein [Streptomyces noursei]MCZ1018457.1 hypothetical protein [Streptomyces noursei]PNE38579.1 hypothetical protein AOB60_31830 [Streptomyces noursei]
MARTHRERGAHWIVPPLFVFFAGAMLTSVISHVVTGDTHTTVMIAGFTLDAIALLWGVVRWQRAGTADD